MTTEDRRARRACMCAVPDPVMQADSKFYCHTCSFETGARPECLEPEAEIRRLSRERDVLRLEVETWRDGGCVHAADDGVRFLTRKRLAELEAAESQLSALSTERDALRANLEAEKHRSDSFERECAALSRVQEGLRALVARWRSRSEVLSGQRRGKAAMMRDCASELDAALSPTPASQSEQEPEFTPEEIAELRRDFDEWLAKRNVSPEVLRLLRPWSEV